MSKTIDLGTITAYGDAKKAGFQGGYNEFCEILANINAGSGIQSYTQLSHKPQINGVELVGNLTSEQLGLRIMGSRVEITTPSTELRGQTVTLTDGQETMTGVFDNTGKCVFNSVLMSGTVIASCSYNGKTPTTIIECPYFSNYKTTLSYTDKAIYSVIIDHSGDGVDDSAMVEYADDAEGKVAGGDDWLLNEPFALLKPCVMIDGVFQSYVDKNDNTKTIDGDNIDTSNVSIASNPPWWGSTVDYLFNQYIEVPCMGLKAEWLDEDRLCLSIAVGEGVSGFDYSAFEYDGSICDKIYLGRKAYQSGAEGLVAPTYIDSGVSWGGTDSRENYGFVGYSQFELLQYLLVLFYKKLRITETESEMLGFYNLLTKSSGSDGITYPSLYVANNQYLMRIVSSVQDENKGVTGYMKKPYGIVGKTFLCKEAGGSSSTYYGTSSAYATMTKRDMNNNIVNGYYQSYGGLYSTSWFNTNEKATTRNGQTGTLYHKTNLRSMIMHKAT